MEEIKKAWVEAHTSAWMAEIKFKKTKTTESYKAANEAWRECDRIFSLYSKHKASALPNKISNCVI